MRYGNAGGVGVKQLRVNGLADDDERLEGDFGGAHFFGNVGQDAPDDLLVRPADPVGDGDGGVRGVAGFLQLGGDAEHPGYAEENHQGAAVARQVGELFAGGHRHAAFGPGHDDGLGNLGDGEFRFEDGGGGKSGADAGDDFVVHALGLEYPHLFQGGAVKGRVAALDAGYLLAVGRRLQGYGHNFGQGHFLAAVHSRAGFGEGGDFRRHQRVGVDDDIGLLNEAFGFEGQQFRVAGAGADDIDFAGWGCGHWGALLSCSGRVGPFRMTAGGR